jgi:hypothetical protein
MIKVATANWYYRNQRPQRDAHLLASYGVDSAGIQEGHGGNAQDIRTALHQNYITWWGTPEDPEKAYAALDVPISIKKSFHIERFWFRQISARAQKKDIGMPRAATVVRFRKDGVWYSHINTHTNAAVQGRDPSKLHLSLTIRRVMEYVKGMIVLEEMINNAKKRGDKVILTGDLNYKLTRAGIWKYSPAGLFKRTGMRFKNNGLDYIAYHGLKCVRLQTIPTTHTGSDHPWLVATLVNG